LTNSKLISGPVDLGNGENTVKNSGDIASLTAGFGNDVVTDTGAGQIGGTIDLGEGDDVFTGGSRGENVQDSDGTDKYSLGGGDDSYNPFINLGGAQNDTIDGGAGKDTYDAGSSNDSIFVNLDTLAHNDAG